MNVPSSFEVVTEVCLRFRVYQFLPESQQSGDRFNVDVNNEYVVKFAAEDTTGNVDQCEIRFSVLCKTCKKHLTACMYTH